MGENYNEILERFGNEAMIRKFAIRFINDPSFGELKDAFQKNDGAEELFKKVEQKYQSVILVLNKLALEN